MLDKNKKILVKNKTSVEKNNTTPSNQHIPRTRGDTSPRLSPKGENTVFDPQWEAMNSQADVPLTTSSPVLSYTKRPDVLHDNRAAIDDNLTKSVPFDLNQSIDSNVSLFANQQLQRRRLSTDNISDTSSVVFQPISPLMSLTSFHDGTPETPFESKRSLFSDRLNNELEDIQQQQKQTQKQQQRPSHFGFEPVDSFQEMKGSLSQTFDERNLNNSVSEPNTPKSFSEKKNTSASNSTKNSSSSKKSRTPKIQNAIEPKFTLTDVPQIVKTPILRAKDDGALRRAGGGSLGGNALSKSQVLRHSFHNDSRPRLGYAQSLGKSSFNFTMFNILRKKICENYFCSLIAHFL